MIEDEQKKQDGGNEEAADKEVLTQPEAAGEDTAGDNAPEPVTPGAGEAGPDEEKTEIPPAPSISGLLGLPEEAGLDAGLDAGLNASPAAA